MPDFSYLNDLEVQNNKTAIYKIFQIELEGKTSELIVLPATQANKRYFNELLKRSKRLQRQVQSGNIDVDLLSTNRDEDKLLYPEYVITGWRHIYDAEGKHVPFSKEACTDFIAALPDWIFDEISNFCRDPQNFVEQVNIDVEELGNGS